MPRLWNATIDEHRRTVHAAILDATATLIAEHGLANVTMSGIAQHAGIGRATLYKYFADVDAIVAAWHERQIAEHLAQLGSAAAKAGDPEERLRTVLRTYTELSSGSHTGEGHEHPHVDMAALLHQGAHLRRNRDHLHALMTDVIGAARQGGHLRTDVPAEELASFCLHALGAARILPSRAARERLVTVTLEALYPHTAN